MNENQMPLLIIGGLLIFLVATGRLKIPGFSRADEASANGVPPDHRGTGLVGALGGAACLGVASAYGQPGLGVAVAPVCSALAPYAVEAVKQGLEKTWEGATFIGQKSAQGLTMAGREIKELASNPGAYALGRVDQNLTIVGKSLNLVDRGSDRLYGALPLPLQVATAPAYAVVQVSTKAGSVAVGAAQTAVSGAKGVVTATGSTVKSTGKAVANFLGF